MSVITQARQLSEIKKAYLDRQESYIRQVLVCGGAGCVSSHCQQVQKALNDALEENGLTEQVQVLVTGCMGTCSAGPVLLVEPDGIFYSKMDPEKVADMVSRHLVDGEVCMEYTFYDAYQKKRVPKLDDIAFFKEQVRVALRNCGRMEFSSLEAYIARDGYAAIAKAVTGMRPADVVDEMKRSGLRGRGGAGFPTGVKWEAGLNAPAGQKYMVCNADEGDPGAFMDRSILEGDPHSVIEAMTGGSLRLGDTTA